MSVGDAESTDFWTQILRGLRERGLKVATATDAEGVALVISDAHSGIKSAVKAILPGAGWQRCRVHFARNVTQRLGSAHSKPVNALISTIFAQTTGEAVIAQYKQVTESLRGSFPAIADMLETAEADLIAFAAMPREDLVEQPHRAVEPGDQASCRCGPDLSEPGIGDEADRGGAARAARGMAVR